MTDTRRSPNAGPPFPLPRAVLDQSTKCRDPRCTYEQGQPLCRVEHAITQNMALVRFAHRPSACEYLLGFGDGHICQCPARLALWRLHGV